MKKSTFYYNILLSGIPTTIKLTAFYDDYSKYYNEQCHKITDNLYFKHSDLKNKDKYPYVTKHDIEYLKLGILLISNEISIKSPFEKTIIGLDELIYLLVDYVPQSITASIVGWAKEAFELNFDEKESTMYYLKWLFNYESSEKPIVHHKFIKD